MNRLNRIALAIFLALAQALMAAPRVPRGIYATVGIQMYEDDYKNKYHTTSVPPDYFTGTVYPELLANTALSGITLYVYWSRVNPNPGAPTPSDLGVINDLFNTVEKYNSTNKTNKTVQLVVTPGIHSPTWLLGSVGNNDGLLPSCNYLFDGTYRLPPAGECGKVTFSGFVQGGWDNTNNTAIRQDLPMPWNSIYKNAWHTFLTALNAEFGSKPELVSIAVAGPTASSEEMILPTTQMIHVLDDGSHVAQLGSQTPEQMWITLLAHHYTSAYKNYMNYQNSDLAFVDEWKNAIDFYGKTFSGITLTVSTGDGLPNLVACNVNIESCSFPIPAAPINFASVCHPYNMDCAAESTVLTYFIQSTVGGSNAKATQMDGMKGRAIQGNLGVPGVKLISELTSLYTSSQRILGGSQFAKRFSFDATATADEGGCPTPTMATDWTCTSEQALYNVLVGFFDGTNQGPNFPSGTVATGGTSGPAPLNYLQIWGKDIQYASESTSTPFVKMGKSMNMVSAQDLLQKASLSLVIIAEN